MLLQKQILKFSLAALLSVALLFPVAVQFLHIFEDHEHKPCTELTSHLHEKKIDCSVCHFHLSNYTYTAFQYPEFFTPAAYAIKATAYITSPITKRVSRYYLRGPPSLS